MDNYSQRHKTSVGVLRANCRESLPKWNGSCYKCVAYPFIHGVSAFLTNILSPFTGNTIDAFKQKAATASTSTSPPNGLPIGGLRKLHVDVGLNGQLAFSPNNITELVGTVVEFSFNPKVSLTGALYHILADFARIIPLCSLLLGIHAILCLLVDLAVDSSRQLFPHQVSYMTSS